MAAKSALGRAYLRLGRWHVAGAAPDPDHVGILLAAPHTSSHDFPLMLATAWSRGLNPRYLAKRELFESWYGFVYRFTGGIPTDRRDPGTLIADLVLRASHGDRFLLVIAPEGTRRAGHGWKSGFYRIAEQAGIPFTLTAVDGPTRTVHFGPTMRASGDIRADMEQIRAFYADKRGINPHARREPHLRAEEDRPADGGQ